MRRFALVLVVLAGCSNSDRAPAAPAPGPAASPAAPAELPEDKQGSEAQTYTVSRAEFRDESLRNCIDYTIVAVPAPGSDATVDPQTIERIYGADEGLVPIAQPCETQFAGRPVFATCARTDALTADGLSEQWATVETRFLLSYYEFGDVFRSDRQMQSCLSEGGEWWSLPEDSREYQRAEIRDATETAQRELKRLRRGR